MIANIPFAPYLHNPQDILFAFFILARVTGLFLISPLLTNKMIPTVVRVLMTIFITIIMITVLYEDYRGDDPKYHIELLVGGGLLKMLAYVVLIIKELAVGFLIGFVFTLIFEGLLVAGQSLGVLMGFSIMEIIDPISNTSRPLLAQLFIVFATLLTLTLDLHHIYLRELTQSFNVLPIGNYHMPYELFHNIATGSSRLFHFAMQYAAIPFCILFLVTLSLGLMAKVMPEMNIFMVGFPLKILVGYYCLILAVGYFPVILQRGFIECINLSRLIVLNIATG